MLTVTIENRLCAVTRALRSSYFCPAQLASLPLIQLVSTASQQKWIVYIELILGAIFLFWSFTTHQMKPVGFLLPVDVKETDVLLTRAFPHSRFDLLANGGASLTLSFERAPFLTQYRTVWVPWNVFYVMDTLVMKKVISIFSQMCLVCLSDVQISKITSTVPNH